MQHSPLQPTPRSPRDAHGIVSPPSLAELAIAVVSKRALGRASEEGNDTQAWSRLQSEILPRIAAIVRAHRGMRDRGLHLLIDDLQEVTTATLERLARHDFRNLRRYVAQLQQVGQCAQSFDSWLYGAVDFAIREHLRQRYGRAPRLLGDPPQRPLPSKRALITGACELNDGHLGSAPTDSLTMTRNLTAASILAFAQAHFRTSELRAMQMHYMQDMDFEAIASALGLGGSDEAAKLIRRLNARLRYRFGDDERL